MNINSSNLQNPEKSSEAYSIFLFPALIMKINSCMLPNKMRINSSYSLHVNLAGSIQKHMAITSSTFRSKIFVEVSKILQYKDELEKVHMFSFFPKKVYHGI